MTEHTVKAYEQELRELTLLVGEMGMLAERQIRNAIAALIKRDEGLASQVIAADDAIDELQRRIEQQAIHMIAKRSHWPATCARSSGHSASPSTWNVSETSPRTSASGLGRLGSVSKLMLPSRCGMRAV